MKNRNFKSKSGVSALEYALIAALIAGVGATGAAFVGSEASSIFNRVAVVVNEGQTLPDTFAGTMSPSSISLEENGSINQTLTTSGGTAPYTYSLQSGSLPNGITLTGNTLSGTVTGTGSYNFTIRATDSDGSVFDQTFSGTVSGDTTPDAFTFTDQTDVATSSLITSNAITVSGLTAPASVSISGDGSPQVSINGGAFTTSGTASNGGTVSVRLTSSASMNTTSTATVDIGGVTDSFSITTLNDPCSGSPSPGTTCADGSIYAGLSPDGNVPMFATPADAPSTLEWGSYGTYRGTTSFTAGETNTWTLAAFGASAHPAAHYCASLSAHGHSDWYLPAINELNILHTNRVAIGGFDTAWYWSSSDNGSAGALAQSFNDGSQSGLLKNYGFAVRCVRR